MVVLTNLGGYHRACGSWPTRWLYRLNNLPLSLSSKPDSGDAFYEDTTNWPVLVSDIYLNAVAVNWSSVRHIMDMNAALVLVALALMCPSVSASVSI